MELIFGYIDPGTGSLFIQAVLGTALAAAVILRSFFKGLFTRAKLAVSRQSVDHEDTTNQ